MTWNYRILFKDGNYQIHEVYYDGDKPISYTENPMTIGSDNLEDIPDIIEKIKMATANPVLYYGEKFPEEYEV